jgi:hypothetical protein
MPIEQPLPPAVDPALAMLDHERDLARRHRGIGTAAAAALDGLGVGPTAPSGEAALAGTDSTALPQDDTAAQTNATPRRARRATTAADIPAQRGSV